ncbi:MAG: periplasmic heavy metal sensor [Hyphomicrobium sp.]|jgi:uncharacterized membrane protein
MSDAPATSRFSPRTLRWVLIGSLALNVLIIGAVVSSLCIARFGGPHGPHGKGFRGSPLIGFARTLPRERADMIRQLDADAQPKLEGLRRGMRDARAAVRAALSAEPFDQAKFDAALDGVVQAETNEARGKTTLFGDTVRQLTPQERVQLHEWLDSRRPIR